MPDPTLHLVVHQTAPALGRVSENLRDIRNRLDQHPEADLAVFPELSLTGYGLQQRTQREAIRLGVGFPHPLPAGCPPVALGFPERGDDELVYNTAALVHGGSVLARHRKVYRPTYGLFDEARYFAAGQEPPPVVHLPSGWKVGLLVCEDFWHPALLYLLAIQGADLVLVMAAAPGRGDPSVGRPKMPDSTVRGPTNDDPPGLQSPEAGWELFSSTETWTLLARTAALQYGFYLALANRAGVEGGLTFAGDSLVTGPSGDIVARAPQGLPATLSVTLSREDLRAARTPYAHLRDEDPEYLRRALDTLRSRGVE